MFFRSRCAKRRLLQYNSTVMELLKKFNDPARTDRYNNKKHHWPQGSITVFAIACCLYTCVRIGYAVEQLFGVNPGPELSAAAIVLPPE